MLNRQKVFLDLLREAGSEVSKVQVMKWAFFLCRETPSHGGNTFYSFVPYHFGPFSFTLSQETDALIRDGYLDNLENSWKLTQAGLSANLDLPKNISADIRYIIAKYGDKTSHELIDLVYQKYPWFTINSKIAGRRKKRPVAETAIYTMGYERLTVDEFLNQVLRAGITRIIDVRNNPVSRRYGFHKSTLDKLCGNLKIEYCHFPKLGIPGSDREQINSLTQYKQLFAQYKDALDAHENELQEVSMLILEKPSTLICMEADPEFCHRSTLADTLTSFVDLPVKHLGWPR